MPDIIDNGVGRVNDRLPQTLGIVCLDDFGRYVVQHTGARIQDALQVHGVTGNLLDLTQQHRKDVMQLELTTICITEVIDVGPGQMSQCMRPIKGAAHTGQAAGARCHDNFPLVPGFCQ